MSCNVIKEYVENSRIYIKDYFKIIMSKYYNKDLIEEYLEKYIDTRYYNQYNQTTTKLNTNITTILKTVHENQTENKEISKFILEIFKNIYYLDDVIEVYDLEEVIRKINQLRIDELGLIEEDFYSNFKRIILENNRKKRKFLNSFDTDDFYLEQTKILNNKIYNTKINYKIKFPTLYSDYAIKNVFNTDITSEDKLFIEYYLISINLLKNIIAGNFKNNYLIEFNINLFNKKDKLKRLLNIIDNDIAKELISLKINYKDFSKHKEELYELMREGYSFSIILDEEYHDEDVNILKVFKYIVVNNSNHKGLNKYNNVVLLK